MATRTTARPAGSAGPRHPPGEPVWRHLLRRYALAEREYLRALAACRRRLSRGAVHRLRVSIRRLLACVELMGAAGMEPPAARGALRRQMRALGKLRDTQVQLKMMRAAGRHGAALEPLVLELRKQRRRQEKAARRALKSRKAPRRLGGFLPGPAPQAERTAMRLREFMERRLRQAEASLALLMSREHPGPGARHQGRVRLRRFHYILDALAPVWHGDPGGGLSRSLHACQGAIGRIHDRELLLRRIRRFSAGCGERAESIRAFCEEVEAQKARQLRACGLLVRRARLESRSRL